MTDTSPSPLDNAMARMQAAPDDTAARLRFHAELAATELFLMLEVEPRGPDLQPRVFDIGEGAQAVLAFDSEARLADFAGGVAVPYAALPGRVLVAMLAGGDEGGISLLLNAGAPHAELMPPEVLAWLAATLAGATAAEGQGIAAGFGPPALPDAALALLRPALERRLSGVPGLDGVVLAAVEWQEGGRGHVLALSGVAEVAQPPLARAVAEALELSGLEAGALDVIFPPATAMARIAGVGLALTPARRAAPDNPTGTAGANPGMDPARPPKLR